MKKLIYTLLVSMLAVFGLQVMSFAASTSSALDSEYLYGMRNEYGKDFNAPFALSQDENGVDTENLSVNISENLLTLPGKNGMDLVLNLEYKSSRSDCFEYSNQTNILERAKFYTYRYTSSKGFERTVLVRCDLEEDVKDTYYAVNEEWLNGILSTSWEGRLYAASNRLHIAGDLVLTLDKTIPPRIEKRQELVITELKGNNNTRGWRLSTPHFQERSFRSSKSGNEETIRGEFTDETGAVRAYTMYFFYPNWDDGDVNTFVVDGLNIEDTQGRRFKLLEAYKTKNRIGLVTHPKGFVYNLSFQNDEGMVYYVWASPSFQQVMAVADRYGNTIVYRPTDEGGIIDTFGRRIKQTTADDGNTSISIVEDGVETELVRYTHTEQTSAGDPHDILSIDNDFITIIIRRESETAPIESSANITAYTSHKREWEYDRQLNAAYALEKIQYPTGAVRNYEYSFSQTSHSEKIARVKEVYDLIDGQEKNRVSYTSTKPVTEL